MSKPLQQGCYAVEETLACGWSALSERNASRPGNGQCPNSGRCAMRCGPRARTTSSRSGTSRDGSGLIVEAHCDPAKPNGSTHSTSVAGALFSTRSLPPCGHMLDTVKEDADILTARTRAGVRTMPQRIPEGANADDGGSGRSRGRGCGRGGRQCRSTPRLGSQWPAFVLSKCLQEQERHGVVDFRDILPRSRLRDRSQKNVTACRGPRAETPCCRLSKTKHGFVFRGRGTV